MIESVGPILLGFCTDLIIGDPRYPFHPVILMGKVGRFIEKNLNQGSFKIARGILGAVSVYGIVLGVVHLLETGLKAVPDFFAFVIISLLFYSLLALKDLIKHALNVYKPLKNNDLKKARIELSYLVGRNTEKLSAPEICRAVIESISENLVDGVTSPLFYGVLFGPKGIALYKAINTLDSLWGHRNPRFEKFGKFAAKVDDLANWIPARMTGPLICLSSQIINGRGKWAFKVFFKDRNNHLSPNGGQTEAAMAGGLGVQLGGRNVYQGIVSERPLMGIPQYSLKFSQISEGLKIITLSAFLFLFLTIGIKIILEVKAF